MAFALLACQHKTRVRCWRGKGKEFTESTRAQPEPVSGLDRTVSQAGRIRLSTWRQQASTSWKTKALLRAHERVKKQMAHKTAAWGSWGLGPRTLWPWRMRPLPSHLSPPPLFPTLLSCSSKKQSVFIFFVSFFCVVTRNRLLLVSVSAYTRPRPSPRQIRKKKI